MVNFHVSAFDNSSFSEAKDSNAPVVEVKLPAVGSPMKNLNIFVGGTDPTVLPDSEYPEWIWSARGPCRAVLRNQPSFTERTSETIADENEKIAKIKKLIISENRNAIRRNNRMLKGSSQ